MGSLGCSLGDLLLDLEGGVEVEVVEVLQGLADVGVRLRGSVWSAGCERRAGSVARRRRAGRNGVAGGAWISGAKRGSSQRRAGRGADGDRLYLEGRKS